MTLTRKPNRREIVTVSALAALGAASMRSDTAVAQSAPATELVAFFTRTGNTRVIAHQIRRARSADLFEIVTRDPYPEDYAATVDQASREQRSGYEPPLTSPPLEIGRYRRVFLGLPIWATDAPAAIRSFLKAGSFAGKTIVPFITHGGFGTGSSLRTIRQTAQGATIESGFSLQRPQERETLATVRRWIDSVPR